MMQAVTRAHVERAEAAVRADEWERDQEAWNLPRGEADVAPPGDPDQLDWDRFLATYFPGSRRHDLKAIAAYAAYKSSGGVPAVGRALPKADDRS